MRQFFAFVEKEFYHIFRDKATMLIILLMPVVQVLIFGFAITTDIRNTSIAVYDQDRSEESRGLLSHITSGPYFRVEQEVQEPEEFDEIFKKGKIKVILVFPPDFSETLAENRSAQIQLITDACNPNEANIINSYIQNIALI
ncbi:MAG: ABC transporter permease, partial [Bacteroidales bacterium]|nr:ABC transporter permease [Bacteroidales bacterium]